MEVCSNAFLLCAVREVSRLVLLEVQAQRFVQWLQEASEDDDDDVRAALSPASCSLTPPNPLTRARCLPLPSLKAYSQTLLNGSPPSFSESRISPES
eukprot:2151193-Pleurochrysis_carterae.AAC.1